MRENASLIFPFAIAVVLPPAGLMLGVVDVVEGDRERGIRLVVVALLAALVWVFLLLG